MIGTFLRDRISSLAWRFVVVSVLERKLRKFNGLIGEQDKLRADGTWIARARLPELVLFGYHAYQRLH
jgi:hypothetical protein